MHMAQHLLLMTISPPLVLLGEPFRAAFYGISMDWFLSRTSTHTVGKALANPVFCFVIATAVLVGWHLPAAFALAMRSTSWHAIEEASFLAGGIMFWLPVVQPAPIHAPSPQWWIPLYLFLATLPCDALSAFLTFRGRTIYPGYLHTHNQFHVFTS
jgi:cytochrome c oxidase assembly factor CtaG